MDFKTYLQQNALKIDKELENFYNTWRSQVGEINEKLLPLLDIAIDASAGGKRLRGVLVKLGYEIAQQSVISTIRLAEEEKSISRNLPAGLPAKEGRQVSHSVRNDSKEIFKPAVAYEIFQTAILAHDDIIDKSPTRRGKPTIYQKLGANHYAISQTICLGDIGFFLSFQILSDSNFPPECKSKAISAFAKSMLDTGFGQMLDVELPFSKEEKSEEDVLTISKYKTAWYTIVGPMQLGAHLAGASDILLEKIRLFGESLGIAFQTQDDILGVFGDEAELGKSVTSDIEEGKNTLLILKARKEANSDQNEALNRLYGTGKISLEDLELLQTIFKETGALDYAHKKAETYVNEAKKQIPEITSNIGYQDLLKEMSDFLIKRSK